MAGGLLILLIGIGTIVCSALNMDFMFTGRKAKLYVAAFGRNGARIMYYILGAIITVMGIYILIKG